MGVTETAKSYMNKVKYVFGADNIPGGVGDCSAFTQYVFKQNGFTIGRTTLEQVKKGTEVKKEDLKSGDLIFFQNTYRNGVSHVGIYIGNNQFIHNSKSNGAVKAELAGYFTTHWHSGRRIAGASSLGLGSSGNGSGENIPIGSGQIETNSRLVYVNKITKKYKKPVKKDGEQEFDVKLQEVKKNVYSLAIIHKGKSYYPVVASGVNFDLERTGVPGKLTFTVIKDSKLNFTEGDEVRFFWNRKEIFLGFVFEKNRSGKDEIEVTCYDQLRYLKNKDSYIYKDITASELIKRLAKDFGLKVGSIADTKYKIKKRVEDNQTLFDMILTALDETCKNRKEIYVMYDSFGKLTLKNISDMKVNLLISDKTAQGYSYKSSIDGETYNVIKLVYNNEEESVRNSYISQDINTMKQWGTLQYYEEINDQMDLKELSAKMLEFYNQKTRSLTISSAFGDTRVRAGSMILVLLELGDIKISNYMMVEKVSHKFDEIHLMDLTLKGGAFHA